jgi:predicted dehydrogenase
MTRKLRFGMIGGGRGAFIGAVHRVAAIMDGQAELAAGAFSSDAARSRASGADLYLDPTRVYGSYVAMVAEEARRPAGERLDFVTIVTPNHQHFLPARLFLEAGFNVVLDKPATFNLAQARTLRDTVRRTGKVLVLTHNYTGHAMVKHARQLVRTGKLGGIRKVVVEYSQGWLSTKLESSGQKQAAWRTDPKRSGAAGCMGDIGTHAENLARYVTGLAIDSLCADLTSFVPGRALDDDGNIPSASRAEPRACFTPPRSASARRTISTSACMAPGPRSNGTRSSRTSWWSSIPIGPASSCAGAMAT